MSLCEWGRRFHLEMSGGGEMKNGLRTGRLTLEVVGGGFGMNPF
jgi:hypothetical protein